jgi:hypothetical protein
MGAHGTMSGLPSDYEKGAMTYLYLTIQPIQKKNSIIFLLKLSNIILTKYQLYINL